MSIVDILITAVVGMLVVFAVLIILMCAINIMAAIFAKLDKTPEKSAGNADKSAEAAVKKDGPAAPGSCGSLTLKNVSDRDAALIMAIVSDKLKTPLNELRFISIKEVEE